jgi:hypothetical protein
MFKHEHAGVTVELPNFERQVGRAMGVVLAGGGGGDLGGDRALLIIRAGVVGELVGM